MYKLTSENLSSLGNMGSSPTTNYVKYFNDNVNAMEYAEKEYRKQTGNKTVKLIWKKKGKHMTTGDLSFVMYNIDLIKTED